VQIREHDRRTTSDDALPVGLTIRAAIDPGILVSPNLTTDRPPSQILELWRRGQFEFIVSDYLPAELADVLERPRCHGPESSG
jgi:hypothetical protein